MVQMQDVILEGLRPGELNILREIDHGSASIRSFDGLAAKGWLDVVGGVPLITLTGRTLLDRHDLSRLRDRQG